MLCFNCKSPLHKSEVCPKPPRHTRCPTCNKVADSPHCHKVWCTNKSFQSIFIGHESSVFEIKPILSIEFDGISDQMKVKDTSREKLIESTVLWLSPLDIFVRKSGMHTLCIFACRLMARSLIIVDESDKIVLTILTDESMVKINNKYTIYENGSVLMSSNVTNETIPDVGYMKIHKTSDIFKVCFSYISYLIFIIHSISHLF